MGTVYGAALVVVAVLLLSLLSMWLWGEFARRAQGAPSEALPPRPNQTPLDRLLAGWDERLAGASGAALIAHNLDAFVWRALAARQAGRSLDVQYYIWRDDLTGRLLKETLIAAAERGVRVRMLIDDLNGARRDDVLLAMDALPNLEVRVFNPARNRETALRRALEMALRLVSVNRRMHNKAWIADNRLALVGGRNIGDEYFGVSEETNFHDADLLLVGDGVRQASRIFDQFWNSAEVIPLRALHRVRPDLGMLVGARAAWREQARDSALVGALAQEASMLEALRPQAGWLHRVEDLRVLSDPPQKAAALNPRRAPERWLMYDVLAMLFSARREVRVISPYFVPGSAGLLLFAGQAARGVDVGIMTNSLAATDVPVVHAGYMRRRKPLLQAGIRLWEMRPAPAEVVSARSPRRPASRASLHTKSFVIDGERGFVGSFNFDPRSAYLNTEMGVMFTHAALAQELRSLFDAAARATDSYRLFLEEGALRWHDGVDGRRWSVEPEAGWTLRARTRLLSWLPIESQL
jgi:putative cardiolipin synthase